MTVAYLFFIQTTFKRIKRVLFKCSVKTTGFHTANLSRQRQPGPKSPGICNLSCECVKVHVGQTGKPTVNGINKHHRHMQLQQPKKLAVAEQNIDLGHGI
jgi:hypothetical protein